MLVYIKPVIREKLDEYIPVEKSYIINNVYQKNEDIAPKVLLEIFRADP